MKRIILAGGGHGHINILKKIMKRTIKDCEIMLITDYEKQYYSGMLPGFIGKIYTEEEISFQVEEMCISAGVKFIKEKIVEIDGVKKIVKTVGINNYKNIKEYKFDLLSINLGASAKRNFGINENMTYVKPINNIIEFVKKIDEQSPGEKKKMVIVGAGASGIELAFAFRARYPKLKIDVISKNDILKNYNKKSTREVKKELREKEIELIINDELMKVDEKNIFTEKNKKEYDYLIISNGVKGAEIDFIGYDVTKDNFLLVDENLKANDYTLAMGDSIEIKSYSRLPKAGVFAIRQAPILYQNIVDILEGKKELKKYTPQKKYLQLINYGDKRALMNYWKISISGKIPWKIKNYIDMKYMRVK